MLTLRVACAKRSGRDVFPTLFEVTPAMFLALDSMMDDFEPEMREAVQALRDEYLQRRHQLLRAAVTEHVKNYVRVTDDEEDRRARLYLSQLGASSLRVAQLQLDRCRLALQTQSRLAEVLGSMDTVLKSPEVK